MEVEFDDEGLDQLEVDPQFTCGFDQGIVKGFRKAMQAIRAAQDERDLYALRGLRFKQMKGDRAGQYSIRLNRQWRLFVELKGKGPRKIVKIIEIGDPH